MLTLSEKDLVDSPYADVSATLDRSPSQPFAVWNAGSELLGSSECLKNRWWSSSKQASWHPLPFTVVVVENSMRGQ